jgi:hypothetical protein
MIVFFKTNLDMLFLFFLKKSELHVGHYSFTKDSIWIILYLIFSLYYFFFIKVNYMLHFGPYCFQSLLHPRFPTTTLEAPWPLRCARLNASSGCTPLGALAIPLHIFWMCNDGDELKLDSETTTTLRSTGLGGKTVLYTPFVLKKKDNLGENLTPRLGR